MIITFSVQNFLSIRDKVTLDFRATSDKTLEEYYVVSVEKPKRRILRAAMIYGANASGKTNLLMALDFLQQFISDTSTNKEIPIPIVPFAMDEDKPSIFEVEFLQKGIVYSYYLELNEKCIIQENLSYFPQGRRSTVFSRNLIDKNEFKYQYSWKNASVDKKQQDALELTVQNQSILSKIATMQYSGVLQEARNWFTGTMNPILDYTTDLLNFNYLTYLDSSEQKKKYKPLYLELLKRADFWIEDFNMEKKIISLGDLPPSLRAEIEEKHKEREGNKQIGELYRLKKEFTHKTPSGTFVLNYNLESAGTQSFFGLIGILFELIYKNRIVPIDEIESSLHIDLIIHFITTFLRNKGGGQLIFTSQNTAILKEKDILRRDAIWITDRKEDGSTSLTSVSDYPVRKEHSIESIYRKGLIGGLPNLGSTLLEDENDTE
ncbi:MAG TPA: ATP-binding protein [Candidatus Cloacimonas sp.]|jgi:AAA15 family ATPase/GTPase|nr:ATP-binding protein [Candidatus Cloacimonas sp.]HPS60664.1 ATP-binding protein [Candidatus Cloacimonas sp.]